MSAPLSPPWKRSPFWHDGGWMCISAFITTFIPGPKRHPPISTLLPPFPYIFSLKKNLGHMPQRNAKCFNSFPPFLSGCHLQGLSLCPEVICSGWTIKAIMVAACFSIMRGDDWQQRDGAGVEGHLASIYLIWKHFFHSLASTQTTKHKQTGQIISFRFLLNKKYCSKFSIKSFSITFLTFLGKVIEWHR